MKKQNLQELFNKYIDVCEYSFRRRPATIKSYKDAYKHFINLIPEIIYPHQLSETKMNEFLSYCKQESVSLVEVK